MYVCVLDFIAYQLLLVVIDRGLRTLFICYLLKNSLAVKKGAKWPVCEIKGDSQEMAVMVYVG